MKITRKDIIYHRKMRKQDWHDWEWHGYMSSIKAQAIDYALYLLPSGVSYNELQAAADAYIYLKNKDAK
jgi:hypothetical protein